MRNLSVCGMRGVRAREREGEMTLISHHLDITRASVLGIGIHIRREVASPAATQCALPLMKLALAPGFLAV